jgi:hypothetical protein
VNAPEDALAGILALHEFVPCSESKASPRTFRCWAQCEGCDWRSEDFADRMDAYAAHRAHLAAVIQAEYVAEREAQALRKAAEEGTRHFALNHREQRWRGYQFVTADWLLARAEVLCATESAGEGEKAPGAGRDAERAANRDSVEEA